MRRIVVLVVLTAVITAMLALSASPAMAFIHTFVPAGECAANDIAADNENAEDMINAHNRVKAPVNDENPIVEVPAKENAQNSGCHNFHTPS